MVIRTRARRNPYFPGPNNQEYDIVNGVFTYDFESSQLLVSLGYIDRETFGGTDITSPFINGFLEFAFGLPPGTIEAVGILTASTFEMTTQEIRLASDGSSRFNYVVGAYRRDPENMSPEQYGYHSCRNSSG